MAKSAKKAWSVEVVATEPPATASLDVAYTLSPSQLDLTEPTVSMVTDEILMSRREHRLMRALEKRASLRRRVAAQFGGRFAAEGGDVGKWQKFVEWLIAHQDEIISFIKKIIGLFAGLSTQHGSELARLYALSEDAN